MKLCRALPLLLLLVACAVPTPQGKLALTQVNFEDLPGWNSDHISEALPALLRSCPLRAQHDAEWSAPCAALGVMPLEDDVSARAFFEKWFQPYAISGNAGDEGLFTGYYEAELHGAWRRGGRYQSPLYERPDDLVTVDLGAFRAEWKDKHIAGKVVGQRLEPYDDRAAIVAGSLAHRAHVLLWVDDPVDAYFLAVQGSGRVRMADGSTINVGYDGANGQSYVAIGRMLADTTEIARPVTMQGIRLWLNTHPDRAAGIMNLNPSYVFFKRLRGDGPIGAEGVVLIPGRSLAVDPSFVPLGTPLWLTTTDGKGAPLQRLVIAQDTGGAIKGPVRGDFFWGFGPEAETEAGAMQSVGKYYLLLPKTHAQP